MGACRLDSPRFHRIIFALYHAAVFFVSLLPSSRLPLYILDLNDKLLHAAEFALFFLLAVKALGYSKSLFWKTNAARIAILWSLAAGGLIEVLQAHVPGRYGDIFDFIADVAGIGAAYAVWLLLRARRRTA